MTSKIDNTVQLTNVRKVGLTIFENFVPLDQRAKKVVSDSVGPVNFAIRLVNSVTKLSVGQVKFFEEFKL